MSRYLAAVLYLILLWMPVLDAAEISRDARRYMMRGQAAMEVAKETADYQSAVAEFRKATESAPQWANAWFNLGIAQEQAEDYAGAITSFNEYIKLNPGASDLKSVEDRIFKLEYKQEKKSEQKAPRVAAKNERPEILKSLTGEWKSVPFGDTATTFYQLNINENNQFELYKTKIMHPQAGAYYYGDYREGEEYWNGIVEGTRLIGTYHAQTRDASCPYHEAQVSGDIEPGGKMIVLKWTTNYTDVGGVKCIQRTEQNSITIIK